MYKQQMLKTLQNQENLTILEALVEDLVVEDNTIKGIILNTKETIACQAVILTTGTYLRSSI